MTETAFDWGVFLQNHLMPALIEGRDVRDAFVAYFDAKGVEYFDLALAASCRKMGLKIDAFDWSNVSKVAVFLEIVLACECRQRNLGCTYLFGSTEVKPRV